jgi:hypothetical protein
MMPMLYLFLVVVLAAHETLSFSSPAALNVHQRTRAANQNDAPHVLQTTSSQQHHLLFF